MTAISPSTAVDYAPTRGLVPRIVALAVAIRVGLWLVGLWATGYAVRPFHPALLLWSRWDAPHYLDIARYGYSARGPDALWIAFFPMYPFLVRVVSMAFGDLIMSGLVVSFLASIGSAYVIAKLVELEGTPDESWRAVVMLFAFPTAYFFAAPYS